MMPCNRLPDRTPGKLMAAPCRAFAADAQLRRDARPEYRWSL